MKISEAWKNSQIPQKLAPLSLLEMGKTEPLLPWKDQISQGVKGKTIIFQSQSAVRVAHKSCSDGPQCCHCGKSKTEQGGYKKLN